MTELEALAQFDAKATFDSGAVDYDKASSRFWSFYGERTVELLNLKPGEQVLDVACGSGSSALPAAVAVGSGGRVIATDLSDRMLDLVRDKAQRRNLRNVEFRIADMTALPFDDSSFDAVVCSLGIFFVEDMVRQVADLWRLVKPGGRLGIATVGTPFFSPMYDVWKSALKEERPDIVPSPPWERTNDPMVVRNVIQDAGLPRPSITVERHEIRLDSPEDWWVIVMGTGLRRYMQEVGAETAARIRANNLAWLQSNRIQTLVKGAIHAVVHKNR